MVFGPSSNYLVDLTNISFRPSVRSFSDQQANERRSGEAWRNGSEELSNLLNTALEEVELSSGLNRPSETEATLQTRSTRVFVVHGQDEEMKQSAARALSQLDLDPIILHEQPSQGRTVIEKFGDYPDVGFAVVLMSPDDYGYPKEPNQTEARPRARQNVIFELGFSIGKLGRGKVAAIHPHTTDFDMPSDYSGVIFVPYDASGAWRYALVRELKAASYDVDANRLI